MYGWEQHVLLRHYLEQQVSITAIAAEVGCDRRTIQRWIAAGDLDRDPLRERVNRARRIQLARFAGPSR